LKEGMKKMVKRIYSDADTKWELENIGIENKIKKQNDIVLLLVDEYKARRKPHCIVITCEETDSKELIDLNKIDKICLDCLGFISIRSKGMRSK